MSESVRTAISYLPSVLLAALALFAPSATVAQDNVYTLPRAQARAVVASYAECVVRQHSLDVRAALQAWSPGRGEPRLPVNNDCAARESYDMTEISLAPATHRYALAEALYAAEYGSRPPLSYDAVPLAPPDEVSALDQAAPPTVRAAYDHAVAERYRLIIGDCVVRTAPAAAHALLVSEVETRAEAAALAGVQPVLAPCLPTGQVARFNRGSLRGILAIAALRLNVAAGAVAPAAGGVR